MSERTITIPYEEYQELNTIKRVMSSEGDVVYVKDDTYSAGNHYVISAVHTKNDYVKRLLRELKESKEREKEALAATEESKDKVHPYWRSVAIAIGTAFITNILLNLFT